MIQGLRVANRAIHRRTPAAIVASTANNGTGDVDIQYDIELIDQLTSVLIANGAQDPEAPLPADPWPAD